MLQLGDIMKKIQRVLATFMAIVMLLTLCPTDMSAATKIKLNKTKCTLYLKETVTLKVVGTNKKVSWTTSDKKIATVSSKGKVTAKKEGKVTITAKVSKKTYKCTVTVKKPSISATKKTVYIGKPYTLKLNGTTIKSVKSSNTKVATVDKKGKVVAKKVGTATITLKGKNGKSYKCAVTVKKPYINATKKTLKEGESYTLKLTGTDIKSVSTSNKKIATVSKEGKVVAKKVGTATITLKGKNGKSYKCTVKVQHKWNSGKITTKATCTKPGIKIYTCTKCKKTKEEKYSDKNAHKFKWSVTKQASKTRAESTSDFGTRIQKCTRCKATGITETMINIGDQVICGVFDKKKEKELCDYLNYDRSNGGWFGILDEMGNTVTIGKNFALTRNDELDFCAQIRAAETAVKFTHTDEEGNPMYWSDSEILAQGYGSAEETYEAWWESKGHAKEMFNPEYWTNGCASFWYDADGSGKNLAPIWVMTFNKEFYQTHVRLEYEKDQNMMKEYCELNLSSKDVEIVTDKNCDELATPQGLYVKRTSLLLDDVRHPANIIWLSEDIYSSNRELLYKKGVYRVSGSCGDWGYVYLLQDAPDCTKEIYHFKGTLSAKDVVLNDGDPYIKGKYEEGDMVYLSEDVLHPKTGKVLYARGYYHFMMATSKGGVIYTEKNDPETNGNNSAWYIPGNIYVYRDSTCVCEVTRTQITEKP